MALTFEQIADQYPIITANLRFLTADEGGRGTSIDLTVDALYRPHLVVQDRNVHEAEVDGNAYIDPYIAMTFIDGPQDYKNGELGIFRFYCPYWVHPEHPDLDAGTEFTVREGRRVVAGGIVIGKSGPNSNPNFPEQTPRPVQ